jgi:hypothetical protein
MQGLGGLPSCTPQYFTDSAIDTSCAFETNDLNLTTANFDSYGNVSFDPCEFTLHTAANNDCNKQLVCFRLVTSSRLEFMQGLGGLPSCTPQYFTIYREYFFLKIEHFS